MFEKEAEEAIMKKYPSSVQGYKSLIKNWKEGAEFGYNKSNEWHDLRKNPDDLPKETEFIESEVLLLLVQLRGTEHKRYELGRYIFSESVFSYTHLKFVEDVVAWCEIPRFEEG